MFFDPMVMEVLNNYLAIGSLVLWAIIVLLPWRPWFTSERFDTVPQGLEEKNLDDVTVLIPARNEAQVIEATLKQVIAQGKGIKVILVNDHSTDDTASLAASLNYESLRIMESQHLPDGWGGKMWGLEQGRVEVHTPYTMLLDADIMISDNLVSQLVKQNGDQVDVLPTHHGTQYRIIEFTQSGVRGNATKSNIESLRLESISFLACIVFRKIAAITHTAGDGIAPRFGG